MPAWRAGVAVLIGLVAACLATILQLNQAGALYEGGGIGGPLLALELATQDAVLQARQPESYLQVVQSGDVAVTRDPRELIEIVAIDERTIAELGAYNGGYPRSVYTELVGKLLQAPPRVIGLDIGFFERTSDDAALAQAFADAQRALTRVVVAGVGRGTIDRGPTGEVRFPSALAPVVGNADVGLSNVLPDERGTVRAMPLLSAIGGTEQPTFGLAVLSAYLRRPQPVDARTPDSYEIAGRRVPVDRAGAVAINYFGPPSATYSTVSLVDVLKDRVDPETWRGKIVLVGASGAAGLADDYWTPVSTAGRKMAGVEIHANVVATLLSTQFLREVPVAVELGLIVGLALLVAVIAMRVRIVVASAVSLALLAGTLGASIWALYTFGWQLPLANPLLAGVLAFVGVVAWRVRIEQHQARALLRALATVIPPSVAQQIARAPERVALGGERRQVTVLFSDLHEFTAFSETLEPQVLSGMMAEYLAEMNRVVFRYDGTLDKFVGDAVMALWNAPLDDAEHAAHACAAALEMLSALEKLNVAWEARGLRRQRMRIGIHTGIASVGNLGTPRRFAYTALGDTVNLAARLEPLNNEYGTRVCVSQTTLDATSGFLARFLDLVMVKGRSTPVPVYELLGVAEDGPRWAPILEAYNQGIVLYQARDFAAALDRFALVAQLDTPSRVFFERCQALVTAPPSAEWNGVYVMQHK